MMKRLSLELGGKNPALVFKDARLDQAVPTLIRAAFLNQGEICLCTSRIYVQEEIYEEFLKEFVASAQKLRFGDPNDPEVFMGALNSKVHLDKVVYYAKLATEEGGTIQCGYGLNSMDLDAKIKDGYYFPPTVVTGLTNDSRCMKEEIFGPIGNLTQFCPKLTL